MCGAMWTRLCYGHHSSFFHVSLLDIVHVMLVFFWTRPFVYPPIVLCLILITYHAFNMSFFQDFHVPIQLLPQELHFSYSSPFDDSVTRCASPLPSCIS